ncbi:unnamed protein product [Polarella glacialis]|uniref:Uncharacterized protein n=1 Tax=Polarella glacialis TaxID=89957 RepID=A0A813LSW5_POLGL|nr:unnamed protein product [Polarella glacialis]
MRKRKEKRDEATKKLQARGYILGFSRDFWLVMSLILFAFVFAVVGGSLMTHSATSWRLACVPFPRNEEEEPSFPQGFMVRVPFKRMRQDHARFAAISFRKAVLCAFLALTYFCPSLRWVNQYGFSMQGAAFVVVLSVGTDLGGTLSACWHNFYGVVLPTLHVMFMYSCYPDGVNEVYDSAWAFAVVDFFVFCTIFLIFNFDAGTRMFALSFQVGYTAGFLDPATEEIFSEGIRNMDISAGDIGPLVGAIIGYVLALLIIGPAIQGNIKSGLAHAQETAIKLAWHEGQLWTGIVKYYMGSDQTIEVDYLVQQAFLAQERTAQLNADLGNSWWECFDSGRTGLIRGHLLELHERMSYMNDWLRGLGVAMQSEDFGAEHAALMAKVSASMLRLSSCTADLLYRSCRLAIGGYSPELDSHQLDEDVKEAQKAFKEAFEQGRKEVYKSDMLAEDSIEEHFVAFALSSYADYVEMLAEDVLSGSRVKRVSIMQSTIDGIKSIPCLSPDHGYMVRCFVAFFGSAFIGYVGVPGLMKPYSAGVASTAAILISSSGGTGSAIVSNMNRFLGIAGGSVLGSVLHALAVPCTPWAPFSGFVMTFIYLGISFFTKFRSPNYGFIGTLSALFALKQLFKPCGQDESNGRAEFETLQTQMLAIFVSTAADVFIGNQSAGHLACHSYKELLHTVLDSLRDAFDPKKPIDADRRAFRGKLVAQYAQAELMGHEATIEPRIYRLPWNGSFYDKLVEQSYQDTVNSGLLRFAIVEVERNPKLKPLLEAMTSSPAAKAIIQEIYARGTLSVALAVAIMNKDSMSTLRAPLRVCKALTEEMPKPLDLDLNAAMKDILAEVNGGIAKSKLSSEKASEDGYCLAGTLGLLKFFSSFLFFLLFLFRLLRSKPPRCNASRKRSLRGTADQGDRSRYLKASPNVFSKHCRLPKANQHAGVDGLAAPRLDGVLSTSVSCRRGALL